MYDFKKTVKKTFACFLAFITATAYIGAVGLKPNASEVGTYTAILDGRDGNSHISYSEKYSDSAHPQCNIKLLANRCTFADNALKADDGALIVQNSANLSWEIDVPESGLYNLYADYLYTDTEIITDSQISLKIDGKVPFTEAEELSIRRLWTNGKIKNDVNGNDLLPEQVQLCRRTEAVFADPTGKSRYFNFFLEKGTHTVSITASAGGFKLYGLTFKNESVADYADYIKSGKSATGNGLNYTERIQAENMLYKNDSAIVAGKDHSNPATVPNDPVKLKLNMLSGSGYAEPGQYVTWEFEVPEDGKYRVGIRARQSSVEGLAVYRSIKIDGETPFSESEEWSFPYDDNWKYTEFGGKNPYCFNLKAGKHTLTLEVTSGKMGEIENRLEEAVYALNYLYRKILVITGATPDTYRDYSLDKEIPELIPAFCEISEELGLILDDVKKITGQTGGQMSIIRQLREQLNAFTDDPATIPSRLSYYKSNVSSLASLMMTMQTQPLDIDYITVLGEQAVIQKTESGFLENSVYRFKSFLGSFVSDYSSLDSGNGESGKQITAWYNGGREAMEIVKQVIDEKFTEKSGISVKLQLVQISLTQAVLAGTAPDAVLNTARDQPINLALRGVLEPLENYEGFKELTSHFSSQAFVPYSHGENVYALPVTCTFNCLFYRKDILEELGVRVPETWQDLYDIIPVLQRNNMGIAMPTAMDFYQTLLIQKGGKFYNDDNTALALNSDTALSAFKEWVELFTKYGLDLTYDFYNRFRTGEMPIGIQSYTVFNQLSAAAPEINGLWDFTYIPGTRKADGSIDRSEVSGGEAAVIVKQSTKKDAAWEFLKWWAGSEAQGTAANRLEMLMGTASRGCPANKDALRLLPWNSSQKQLLIKQIDSLTEVPEVIGSYYVTRSMNNAFRNAVYNGENYRETLMEQVARANEELQRKKNEIDKKSERRE